jgi:hypothetical protein
MAFAIGGGHFQLVTIRHPLTFAVAGGLKDSEITNGCGA